MSLQNKVAYITGGTKGIGFGIAQSFLQQGMKVAISSRSQDNADKAVAELKRKFPKALLVGVAADVTDYHSQQQAVEQITTTLGAIDVVIANAGVGHFDNVIDLSVEKWNEVIDTNLTGVFYTLKATVASLQKTKGYFITISSLAGTNFFAQGTAYNASKFGLTGFTQAAMLDLRKDDIKVSTIMPGSVATHFNGHIPNDADAWKIQPEDIAKLTIDLLTMHPRTLPSKIEVRPTRPDKK